MAFQRILSHLDMRQEPSRRVWVVDVTYTRDRVERSIGPEMTYLPIIGVAWEKSPSSAFPLPKKRGDAHPSTAIINGLRLTSTTAATILSLYGRSEPLSSRSGAMGKNFRRCALGSNSGVPARRLYTPFGTRHGASTCVCHSANENFHPRSPTWQPP
jgi:hypothetical protein